MTRIGHHELEPEGLHNNPGSLPLYTEDSGERKRLTVAVAATVTVATIIAVATIVAIAATIAVATVVAVAAIVVVVVVVVASTIAATVAVATSIAVAVVVVRATIVVRSCHSTNPFQHAATDGPNMQLSIFNYFMYDLIC